MNRFPDRLPETKSKLNKIRNELLFHLVKGIVNRLYNVHVGPAVGSLRFTIKSTVAATEESIEKFKNA